MIETTTRGRALVVTLARPGARNAINGEMARGIEAAIDHLEDDEDLWAGVLNAQGPVFCAGADLKEIAASGIDWLSTERGGFAGLTRRDRRKPLIAAVDGAALAGGCELVLACDLVVASTDAQFGIPEVRRSLIAGGGGLHRLPRTMPVNAAMYLALTGEPIDATRAYDLGLVARLTEPGSALAGGLELAQVICQNAPLAVQASREVLLGSLGRTEDEAWTISEAASRRLTATADFAEGPRAFLEKREPVWTGR
jgi:enoyl-CoA hydratase